MKHAGDRDLDRIEDVLAAIRKVGGVKERKRGIFYRGSVAFLHFHVDPAGLFADLKVGGGWRRLRVDTAAGRRSLLSRVGRELGRNR